MMAWASGEDAWRAFAGVAPLAVDRRSAGFAAATFLFDMPPRAAAVYLAPYLLALLEGLETQREEGYVDFMLTRGHTLSCLLSESFWERVIRAELPPERRALVVRVAHVLAAERVLLGLTEAQVERLRVLAGTTS